VIDYVCNKLEPVLRTDSAEGFYDVELVVYAIKREAEVKTFKV